MELYMSTSFPSKGWDWGRSSLNVGLQFWIECDWFDLYLYQSADWYLVEHKKLSLVVFDGGAMSNTDDWEL